MRLEDFGPDELKRPLDQISTVWTMVMRARGGPLRAEADAQQQFMERYHGAIYRYFLTALRDHNSAQDLFQEFAERFLQGSFDQYDPAKGRFRHYVKSALTNMIHDYRKRQILQRHVGIDEIAEPIAPPDDPMQRLDTEFLKCWRDELLSRTWESLKKTKRRSGLPFHVLLGASTQDPHLTSLDLAKKLNKTISPEKPFSEVLIRKTLQLAREKFADLLVDEVSFSLGDCTLEQLEQELIDLDLHGYCRGAMELRWIVNG